ncbi:MAG: DUF7159 family protein [Mycobacterium sp.]
MDAVLGLSVTPSAVGLVLVQGQGADSTTVDGAGFELDGKGSLSALQTSDQAAAAVLRSEAMAADRGHRVHSIGVTWSDESDAEASLLLRSLSDSGFDNIVPVRLSEATDALARGVAGIMGYQTTAVCVIEPEQLIALIVQTDEGAVQTAVNHAVVTEEDLVGWLSAVFTKADWQPEALVLLGSAEDLEGLLPVLEEALSVPVFSPAEAQLALARGAALACAQNADLRLAGTGREGTVETKQPTTPQRTVRRLVSVGPTAMLAAATVTFVVSVSAALALHAAPERSAPQARPSADDSAQVPAAVISSPAPAPPQSATPLPEPAALPASEIAEVPPPEAEPAPQAEPSAPEAPVAEPPAPEAPLARTIAPQPDVVAPALDAPLDGTAPGFPASEMMPPPEPEESAEIPEGVGAIDDDPPPPGTPLLP